MTFGPYPATVADEHDGDTIFLDIFLRKQRAPLTADIDLGFNLHLRKGGLWLIRQSVRTLGDNAPELATPEGKAALAYLQTILHAGDPVTLISHGWDKYGGRIDGAITLPDGRDLAATMITAGQAKPWDGTGPKPV
jgi:endonuclease YncB( thermonuclease family)